MSIDKVANNTVSDLYSGSFKTAPAVNVDNDFTGETSETRETKQQGAVSGVIPGSAPAVTVSVSAAGRQAATSETKPSSDVSDKELAQKLQDANKALQTHFDVNNKKLDFSIHDESGRMVVKVVDPESGDVLKELPSEAVLKMAANIEKFQENVSGSAGFLFDEIV